MNACISQELEENRIRWQPMPHIYELDDLIDFCGKYDSVYVYGKGIEQQLLVKYLWLSGVLVKGYVVSFSGMNDKQFIFHELPVISREQFLSLDGAGIILGLSDTYYGRIIPIFRRYKFHDYFIMTEHSKHTIAKKMAPIKAENIPIEVNLVDHCNLRCQCCDHFSPISDEWYLDLEQFERDVRRLAELSEGKIGLLKLLGGEPLLHDQLTEFLFVARKYLSETCIQIFTNGLLASKWGGIEGNGNIWEDVKKYEVQLNITRYPIDLNIDTIIQQAKNHGIVIADDPPGWTVGALLYISNDFAHKNEKQKSMIRFPMDLSGNQKKYDFVSCHLFNSCISLRNGEIYTCPRCANIEIFRNRFPKDGSKMKARGINIYDVSSFDEISEFCTVRPEMCDFCAIREKSVHPWKQSDQDIEEWAL